MSTVLRLGAYFLGFTTASWAGGTVEPFLQRGYGSTWYRLELTERGNSLDTMGRMEIQSELEYPLDVFSGGFRARHEWGGAEGKQRAMHASAWGNFTDPTSKMKDSDWIGNGGPLYKISYTRSRTELRGFGGEAGMDLAGRPFLGKPIRYGLALRAEYFSFEMFGAEGWQRIPGPEPVFVEESPGSLVLTYELLRVMPRLYADMTLARGSKTSWNAVVSAGPAFAKDHDDHVLRLKESETQAYGFELGLRTGVALRISSVLSLTADADLAWMWSKGDMDQRWYGDDPFTPKDETGVSIRDVETHIQGLGGGASVGMRFHY